MNWLLVFILSMLPINRREQEVDSYICTSYIVYDGLNNKVLEGHDVNNQRSVASISKIMTAIVTIEYGMLDGYITVGDWIRTVDGSSVYLYVGEVINIEELLYGLMLRSGNDCAISLAMYVSGNVSSFVDKMNSKAMEIGMKNTIFRNPSGLDSEDGGNLSTVYDMALLSAYAMKNEKFREIVATKEYKSKNHGFWFNKNKLLKLYKYAIGGKTGYTKIAKRTLVSMARKEETELIVVTFNCGGDFSFHKNLYEKWFSKYRTFKVIEKGINYIDTYVISCPRDIYINSMSNEKVIVNYHLVPSEKVMKISTSESKEIVGECSIKEKIEKKKKVNWFKKIINKIKGMFR